MKKREKFLVLLIAIITICVNQSGAQIYSSYQNNGYDPIARTMYSPGINLHTSVKPYRLDEVSNYYSVDSLVQRDVYKPSRKLNIFQRFVHDDLFRWEDEDENLMVRINPLANFEIGKEFSQEKNIWVNTRGIMVEGQLGKNVAFYADFYENQAVFPQYIHEYIRGGPSPRNPSFPSGRAVVPGQGKTKIYKEDGFDFSQATGYISYNAGKYINLQLCYGKNFLGDGYRSLLLSDFANPYNHVKMTATFWKVKYWWMIAQFKHHNTEPRYPYKYGAFHYFTWNIGKRFSFGIFESVIWAEKDDNGDYRGIDFSYVNPVLFYRPVEYTVSNSSPDNMFVGANMKYIVAKGAALYGQFILNEFKLDEIKARNGWWANKWGYQIGAKYYNVFGINNLDIQSEINVVRPFTYTYYHPVNNYGHATQELAHPLGANFHENVSILRYRWKRWHIEVQNMYAIKGEDKNVRETAGYDPATDEPINRIISYGGDIFKPSLDRYGSHGHTIGQGLKTEILNFSGELSWLINPKTNMNIAIGGRYRTYTNDNIDNVNKMFYITLRTSLRNLYYDF